MCELCVDIARLNNFPYTLSRVVVRRLFSQRNFQILIDQGL